ncbi:MerR family transcriptional regulator [Paenibacillus sp. M1]|uniref:MerR family transcriptional regulator n=1 Tax=Paenibacillus haidiansis TaxID=1574488 RepID=A0ABU7VVV8_9BACL
MLLTVKEVSSLAHVSIKTLHHYHKIGLLEPSRISESGYRLYGTKELERLQEICVYRELDFPLEQIKRMLEGNQDRKDILIAQRKLIAREKQRMEQILGTLDRSIACLENGETMDRQEMFHGFATEEEWTEALQDQNQYLRETYQVDMLEDEQLDVADLNEQAAEAAAFMAAMAENLRSGLNHEDEAVKALILKHLEFLHKHDHPAAPADFASQTRFFLQDDFHRGMLEGQQTGLAYYLSAAAESLAKANEG